MNKIAINSSIAAARAFTPGEPDNKPQEIEYTSIDSRFDKQESPDGKVIWKLKKSEGETDKDFSIKSILNSPNRETLAVNGFLPFEENKSVDNNRPTPFNDYNHTWDHTVSGTGNGPQYWNNKSNYYGSV